MVEMEEEREGEADKQWIGNINNIYILESSGRD